MSNLEDVVLHEGDTLVVMADDTFIPTWGESSVFVLLTNGNEPDTTGKKKRWFALLLLVLMIVGATVGELPVTKEMFPDIKLDMFFFVSITTIIMAGQICSLPVNTLNIFVGYIDYDCLCVCYQ